MVIVRDNCKFLSMHVSCCSSGVHKARLISTLYVGMLRGMLHAVVRYFEVQIYIYYTKYKSFCWNHMLLKLCNVTTHAIVPHTYVAGEACAAVYS